MIFLSVQLLHLCISFLHPEKTNHSIFLRTPSERVKTLWVTISSHYFLSIILHTILGIFFVIVIYPFFRNVIDPRLSRHC